MKLPCVDPWAHIALGQNVAPHHDPHEPGHAAPDMGQERILCHDLNIIVGEILIPDEAGINRMLEEKGGIGESVDRVDVDGLDKLPNSLSQDFGALVEWKLWSVPHGQIDSGYMASI